MAEAKPVVCKVCGDVFKDSLAQYRHNKAMHPELITAKETKETKPKAAPVVEPSEDIEPPVVDETPAEEVAPVVAPKKATAKKETDPTRIEGIEMLKSFCRSSLNDTTHLLTFNEICKQDFAETYIPYGIGEGEGAQMEFGLNGTMFVVPKGVRVILPRTFLDEVYAQNKIQGFAGYRITEKNPNGKLITLGS